jgi:hypothetical protein
MFYLDCILYIILLILAWILIDKIINQNEFDNTIKGLKYKPKEGFNTKEGFAHRGNAIVVKNPGINQIGINDLNPNSKEFDVFAIAKGFYNFLSIFADVFVKFPNKYVRKLGNMAQGPLEALANKFKEILKKCEVQAREILEALKPYTKFAIPFSLADMTKRLTTLIDKIFGSIGRILKPNRPN